MLESGDLVSIIMWGPPGSGKTTLARLAATEVGGAFEQLSATSAGVKDVLAKSMGSNNSHNVVKAAMEALKEMRTAADVAKERGMSVRELFGTMTEAGDVTEA